MKKLMFVCVLLALLASFTPAKAMETVTYTGYASYKSHYVLNITTLREGNITVHAHFNLSNHGLYVINIWDANGNQVCTINLDARWGRATSGDLTCSTATFAWTQGPVPAGNYQIEFFPAMGQATPVTMEVTAETNP